MDLREQQYMLEIARYGSIKLAAEALHISPPALSIFLRNLEERIGIVLFYRIGKQFVPTEAGKLYLEHAKQMLEIRDHYQLEMQHFRDGITGTIHFGIHPRRTLHLLAPVLTEFAAICPHIEVVPHEESSALMQEHLLKGELDFIITNLAEMNPAFSCTPYYQDHLVAAVRAGHPQTSEGKKVADHDLPWIDLKLFDGERLILQKPEQSIRYYEDHAISASGIQPGQTFILENMETACQMAAEGYGIAFTYECYAREFHYPKPVRFFLVGDPAMHSNYYLATLKGKEPAQHTNELIRLFMEHI
jgi:DNA-binding transcriptional LysR family regulator